MDIILAFIINVLVFACILGIFTVIASRASGQESGSKELVSAGALLYMVFGGPVASYLICYDMMDMGKTQVIIGTSIAYIIALVMIWKAAHENEYSD